MRYILLLTCIGLSFSYCSNEGNDSPAVPEPEIALATSVKLLDIANTGTANDFELVFNLSSTSNIEELRGFIVTKNQSDSFDLRESENVESENYIHLSLSERSLRLSSEAKDTNGDAITEGGLYVAYILAIASEDLGIENKLSQPSSEISLERISAVSTLTSNISGGSGGMDVDSQGNIYMSDFGTRLGNGNTPGTKVFRITTDGKVSVFAQGLIGASGSDFDIDGNLIQSNISGGSVSKITPEGTVSTLATGFTNPVGVTVAENGDFYVCDCNANTIRKVTNNGADVSVFVTSSLMNCPNGIDMDEDGNLYVANFSNSNLVKITPEGSVSVLATMPGNNNGHLLINGDYIYVISRGLHQIHRVTFNGTVSLFAGNGTRGIVNGPLLEAGFSFPNDLAFSPDGSKMYVNDVNAGDDGNVLSPCVIREIDIVE